MIACVASAARSHIPQRDWAPPTDGRSVARTVPGPGMFRLHQGSDQAVRRRSTSGITRVSLPPRGFFSSRNSLWLVDNLYFERRTPVLS